MGTGRTFPWHSTYARWAFDVRATGIGRTALEFQRACLDVNRCLLDIRSRSPKAVDSHQGRWTDKPPTPLRASLVPDHSPTVRKEEKNTWPRRTKGRKDLSERINTHGDAGSWLPIDRHRGSPRGGRAASQRRRRSAAAGSRRSRFLAGLSSSRSPQSADWWRSSSSAGSIRAASMTTIAPGVEQVRRRLGSRSPRLRTHRLPPRAPLTGEPAALSDLEAVPSWSPSQAKAVVDAMERMAQDPWAGPPTTHWGSFYRVARGEVAVIRPGSDRTRDAGGLPGQVRGADGVGAGRDRCGETGAAAPEA